MKIPTKTRSELQYVKSITGLARLSERILLSLRMRNFSPVDRDEIYRNKIVPRRCLLFVESGHSYKVNSHTSEVEIHTKENWLRNSGSMSGKAKLFSQKSFVCPHAYGKIPLPAITEISVTRSGRLLIWTYRNFYEEKSGKADLGKTEPAQLTRLIRRGPY